MPQRNYGLKPVALQIAYPIKINNMNSYPNHYNCPFYSEALQYCAFSPDKLTLKNELQAQCGNGRTLEEIMEEESNNPFIHETLAMLRRLPPSYVTHQRITAIERILNEQKNEKK